MSFYLGTEPVPQAILRKESTTLTAGQTVINTGGYSNGDLIQVSLNGVIIEGSGVDYTASNGSDITLTVAGNAGDVLQFQTFDAFELVGSKFAAPTITNDVTLKNNTEEDTDGGRSSKLVYKGEQSGGQESTLAEIQASHDGSANDQKADLIFRTNDGNDGTSPTEAMRIDSSGNVGIGNSSVPAASDSYLTVGTQNYAISHNGFSKNSYFDGSNYVAPATGSGKLIQMGDDILFYSAASVSAGASQTLVEQMRILSSGGITFNGDTAAANALDDYEEGTWTPQLWKTSQIGMQNAIGSYIKVGGLVWLSAYLYHVSCSSSGTGNWEIRNLPFNVLHLANAAYQFAPTGYMNVGGSFRTNDHSRWQANHVDKLTMYSDFYNTNCSNQAFETSFTGCFRVA